MKYERTHFVSAPDEVFVSKLHRIQARRDCLSRVILGPPGARHHRARVGTNELLMTGTLNDGKGGKGLTHVTRVRVVTKGGIGLRGRQRSAREGCRRGADATSPRAPITAASPAARPPIRSPPPRRISNKRHGEADSMRCWKTTSRITASISTASPCNSAARRPKRPAKNRPTNACVDFAKGKPDPGAGRAVFQLRPLPADRLLPPRRACPRTCRASGRRKSRRRGTATGTSTSTCR